jgi:hypothetical protein
LWLLEKVAPGIYTGGKTEQKIPESRGSWSAAIADGRPEGANWKRLAEQAAHLFGFYCL